VKLLLLPTLLLVALPSPLEAGDPPDLDRYHAGQSELVRAHDADIALLAAEAFPALPPPIRRWLQDRGFTVPQGFCAPTPNNAFQAHLGGPSTRDWAILCSRADTSRIVIFWDGRPDSTLELNPLPDAVYFQEFTPGRTAYSRLITPAQPAEVLERYHEYDSEPPVVVDHTAVEDSYCEKGSTIHYWHQGRMVQLMGAD